MLCVCYKWEQEAGKTEVAVSSNQLAAAKYDHGQKSWNHIILIHYNCIHIAMDTI